jgi:hypothetical protein
VASSSTGSLSASRRASLDGRRRSFIDRCRRHDSGILVRKHQFCIGRHRFRGINGEASCCRSTTESNPESLIQLWRALDEGALRRSGNGSSVALAITDAVRLQKNQRGWYSSLRAWILRSLTKER